MNKSGDTLVRVTIFGQEYMIRGKAEPEYIERVAKYVNDKMEEIENSVTSSHSALKIAILAAMNITDELFSARRETEDGLKDICRRSEILVKEIDRVIEEK